MTEEQINIAIAESMGWTEIVTYTSLPGEWFGTNPNGKEGEEILYASSLDACAEFEASLGQHGQTTLQMYRGTLVAIVTHGLGMTFEPTRAEWEMTTSASAPQRCEAYLRTIGKWIDSNQQPT